MTKTNEAACGQRGPGCLGWCQGCQHHRVPPAAPSCCPVCPSPHQPLLTEVEVAALVLGLEEAAPCLGMDVGSLGHQQLHIVFAAAFDGDVQGSLAWEEVGDSHQGPGGVQSSDQVWGVLGRRRWRSTPGQQGDLQTFPDVEYLRPEVPDLLHHTHRSLGSRDIQLGGPQMWGLCRLVRAFHARGNNSIVVSQDLGCKIHSL